MSQTIKVIFGTLAVSLTLGAVQFASGHDLIGRATITPKPETAINRAAKADRDVVLPSLAQTKTVALRFDSLADTSILVRVPVAKDEARGRPAPPQFIRSGDRKTAIACEPVVSVLTE